MVRPVPWPSLAHHILPTNSSIGAPLGLSGSSAGSWRPSKPNQLPHWTGMISPFLVMLPLSSTRKTPSGGSPPLPSSPPSPPSPPAAPSPPSTTSPPSHPSTPL